MYLLIQDEYDDLHIKPSGSFAIPRGFEGKSAHLFAQVSPKIRPLMESPWNGEAAGSGLNDKG